MKRIISIILAIVICVSGCLVLAACSDDKDSGKDNTHKESYSDNSDNGLGEDALVSVNEGYEDAIKRMADVSLGKATKNDFRALAPDEFWRHLAEEEFDSDMDGMFEGLYGALSKIQSDTEYTDADFKTKNVERLSSTEIVDIHEIIVDIHGVNYPDITDGYAFSFDSDNGFDDFKFFAVEMEDEWYLLVSSDNKDDYMWLIGGILYINYLQEAKAEVAKSSFTAVIESYNGYWTIEMEHPIEIDSGTTIQQVVDALEGKGQAVTVDHIDTSRKFLDYCEEQIGGYYLTKSTITNEDWLDLYVD